MQWHDNTDVTQRQNVTMHMHVVPLTRLNDKAFQGISPHQFEWLKHSQGMSPHQIE